MCDVCLLCERSEADERGPLGTVEPYGIYLQGVSPAQHCTLHYAYTVHCTVV